MSSASESEKKIIKSVKEAFGSNDEKVILKKINELKSTGRTTVIPLLLDLLENTSSETVREEILSLLSNLRIQECAAPIANHLDNSPISSLTEKLIESCWQSRLDFSENLLVFAKCFIAGNFQTSIESFTVIEEVIWKTTPKARADCRSYLIENLATLDEDKKALFHELVSILESGKSQNSEDYPELYS